MSRVISAVRTLAVVGTVSALTLTGCSGNGDSVSAGPLITEGTLKVCSDPSYPPFESTKDGEFVGFDIDLADLIATDLSAEVEIVSTAFEGIQSGLALDTKQCDVAISGMSINETRAKKFDFSESYFDDSLALLVTKDSGITSLKTLGDAVVGVQQGTTGETFANDEGLKPRQFEDSALAIQALNNGDVQAVINNIATVEVAAKNNTSLVVADTFATEKLGVGVRAGNTELLDSVNATIARIYEDGTHKSLVEKWMQ
ncbi:transporter substrate-binding domain-containing protein [Klugiella xanthotipulae]|uniref:Amino acid ABC transporter substrate-binding protein (PAAT family) n=1 Tax=Klugiella xanthotipulae TaxID=244735 RepID=A0A543I4C3_9MICO|nr:transporter substrate-binding domain-containing protein [Klugiella xanthotipulae]TQM65442.1 amino acid ABC transporter substrate-binding protein (PAAT family) [Klugiella xanthotipulae]